MMIYSTIYAVKSNGQYEANVRKLDKELEDFQAQLPAQLRGGPQMRDEDRVNYLYIEMAVSELQLLIHHPSLCRSAAPQVMQSNLDSCLHWSDRLLVAATHCKELKSLDTTWYSTTNYLAAIFTTLFAYNERRDQITSTELQKLRQDMDSWMDVIKEVSILLGKRVPGNECLSVELTMHTSGTLPQLQVAVRQIVDISLGNITRHLAAKTASAAVNASSSSPVDLQPQQQAYGIGYNSYTNGSGQSYAQQPNSYPSNANFTYTEPQNNSMTYASSNHFDAAAYHSDHGESKPNMEAQLTAHNAQTNHMGPSDFLAAFSSPHAQVGNAFSSPPVAAPMNGNTGGVFQNAGPAAWRSFADNMMSNMHHEQPNDYAAALMALGASNRANDLSGTGMENVAATMGSMLHVPIGREYEQHAQVWPLIQFSGSMGQ
jgi:hypothetical protein